MKVLILSHNPISTYQNMGKTFLSLFSSFAKDELCQLYIYPTIPDIDLCSSYYRITDKNVIDSYLRFGRTAAREITSDEIDPNQHSLFESKEDEKLLRRKKSFSKLLLRDLIWKFARWYTPDLEAWLQKEKPDRIFLAPGESKFIYDIALLLHRKFGLPIITYLCDEFYFLDPPKSPVGKLHFHLLGKKIERLMACSSGIVTICDELSTAYHQKFGVPAATVFTGSDLQIDEAPALKEQCAGITYLGNIANDRLHAIVAVAEVLQQINAETGSDFQVFLYTGSLTEKQRSLVEQTPAIAYCGYVVGDDYKKVLLGSDLLLHVESFKKEAVNLVRHSISTKIAESLASGIPLIAYGPASIASMTYLKREQCAVVADSAPALKQALLSVLFDVQARRSISRAAIRTAGKNHSSKNNSLRLKTVLSDFIKTERKESC